MAELKDSVELAHPDDLIPYSNNVKAHPDEQVKKIASSIKNYGWDQPIVVDGSNEIIKGHGRLQAAELLGLEQVPVIVRDDLTEAEARASRIADNKTAESEWLDDELESEIDVLAQDDEIDMDSLGFDDDEMDDLLNAIEENNQAEEVKYTDKIETPVYEPTGREPNLDELYDREKYEKLKQKIQDADIGDEEREFLLKAAQRHIIFDYENIAEYYAHQDQTMQELMEALTLVIVDFDQAVEQGFISFAENVLEGVDDA